MGSPKPHARSSCPGSPVERSHYGAINTGARAIIGRLEARDLDRIFGSKLSRSASPSASNILRGLTSAHKARAFRDLSVMVPRMQIGIPVVRLEAAIMIELSRRDTNELAQPNLKWIWT